MAFSIWVCAPNNSPIIVCPGGSEGQSIDKAQQGWDLGKIYSSDVDLADYLERQGKKLSRLAICAHGNAGMVDINGVFPPNESLTSGPGADDAVYQARRARCLSVATFDQFRGSLNRIGNCMEDESIIYFMSCNMATQQAGADLLMKLSAETWRKSLVVGFIRIGTAIRHIYAGRCDLPGMKFGIDNENVSRDQKQADNRLALLTNDPWADENNILAKTAKGGTLKKDPERIDAFGYLIGRWNFEAGDWKGVLGFEGKRTDKTGPCYWQTTSGSPKHPGTWTRGNGAEITFKFDDDAKGWQRLFSVEIKASSNSGKFSIGGVQHGFFTIWTTRDLQ